MLVLTVLPKWPHNPNRGRFQRKSRIFAFRAPSAVVPKSIPSCRAWRRSVRLDKRGQRYLDFSGSAAVNFIGHGVDEIPAAMAEQARKVEFVHSSQFTTPIAEEYAQEL